MPDISANYDLQYKYTESGAAAATLNVYLRNLTSSSAVSQFQLLISYPHLEHLQVLDSSGPLPFTTTPAAGNTQISVNFKNPVIGKNSLRKFSLQFIPPPARHDGQVWTVATPKFISQNPIGNLELTLTVPLSFGKPTDSSLPYDYYSSKSVPNYQIIKFSKPDIRPGLQMSFGNLQTYQLAITYRLRNISPESQSLPLTLPPDTNYQTVTFSSLQPRPLNIVPDSDGNWLASYWVPANSTQNVNLNLLINVKSNPTSQTPPPANYLPSNLLPTTYWPSSDPKIVSLAHQFKSPRQIYDYVVATLGYDLALAKSGQAKRRGASIALATPQNSVCTEFTDLFIALARAAGIPAREVIGAPYAPNATRPASLFSASLHSWPQYWDDTSSTWISVDPTWGKTSESDYFTHFDLNHLSFVIHGQSDTSPEIPSQDLQIQPALYSPLKLAPPLFVPLPPRQFFPLITQKLNFQIENPNPSALYHLPVDSSIIDQIPPYSSVTLSRSLPANPFLGFGPVTLQFQIGHQPVDYNLPQSLFIVWQLSVTLILASVIIAACWFASRAWGLYLQKHPRPNSLRW